MARSPGRTSVYGGAASGARLERMVASPRYGGGRFRNTAAVTPGLERGTAFTTLGEFFLGGQARTPPGPLPVEDPRLRWGSPPPSGLRVTWLGHSTLLVEIDGVRVLTDPVFGERASPFSLAGPRRFHPVPVALSDLPPIDCVLVSHDHYDHLCHPTMQALAKTGVPFVTALGVGAHLEAWGIEAARITELDWWEEVRVAGGRLTFTATPSQHFSGRGPRDRNRTLWASWVMTGERHRVFFSGDTGPTDEFAEIGRRLGPFDLVMLEIGAYHPSWGNIHLGPANAVRMHGLLGGGTLLPVHWGTFNLALHAWDAPGEEIARIADKEGVHVITPRLGRPVVPREIERIDPWWREVAGSRALVTAAAPRAAAAGSGGDAPQ